MVKMWSRLNFVPVVRQFDNLKNLGKLHSFFEGRRGEKRGEGIRFFSEKDLPYAFAKNVFATWEMDFFSIFLAR